MTAKRTVWLISRDLLVGSQLRAVVPAEQFLFQQVRDAQFPDNPNLGSAVVVLDLTNVESSRIAPVVERIRNLGPAVLISFGPHVQLERLAAARQAGCEFVVHRGGVAEKLREVVARSVGE